MSFEQAAQRLMICDHARGSQRGLSDLPRTGAAYPLMSLAEGCVETATCDYGIGSHSYEYDEALVFPEDPWRELPFNAYYPRSFSARLAQIEIP